MDLSHGLGYTLGKQLPMTAIYRVKGIGISIRPVDDIDDNDDGGIMFGGQIKWLPPNKHMIDAIQAAREVERLSESTQIDTDSDLFGTATRDYTGFRFGWRTESDVIYATREGFDEGDEVEGGTPSWCLFEDDGALGILDNYNSWKGLTPHQDQNRALWTRRVGHPANMKWAVSWVSHGEAGVGVAPQADYRWQSDKNHIDVVGGILLVDVQYSSTDSSSVVDDDYTVHVTVEVEGWEAF